MRKFIGISLLFHFILIVIGGILIKKQTANNLSEKTVWVDIVPNDPSHKTITQPEKNKNKVVQTSPGTKVDRPTVDSFLAWQNQVVDRETVSKNKETVMASAKSRLKKNTHSLTPLSQLGLPILPSSQKTYDDGPNWATLGTRAEDFVEGMKESDRTALNTQEYKYYGYYQRIRSRLDRAWVPILRQKLINFHKNGRSLASDMDHMTRVLVFLNDKGDIVRVQLVNASGVNELDDAAVAAFNKAGPFPNPPKGMIDRNREVQVPWDFILKT